MLYLLFIVTIILFLSTYYICNRDILAPSVLCCIMYIISIMFAVLNIKNWGNRLSNKNFWNNGNGNYSIYYSVIIVLYKA